MLGHRKMLRQTCSRATVDAILDATIRVLPARGYQGTTTIAVAERAGVSVGSLYQYFPHKDALIAALVKRHLADVVRCVDEAFATLDGSELERAIRAIVRAGITAHRIHPALHEVLVEQVPRHRSDEVDRNDRFGSAPILSLLPPRRRGRDAQTTIETIVTAH